MKFTYILILGIIASFSLMAQETITETIMHDGVERTYNVHIPPNFDASQNLPLVLNFHGLGSNAFQQEFYSQFNAVSDTANMIVCYPEGINNQWNTGFGTNTDDVGFTHVMLDALIENYGVDQNRVYSTGMSNGGYMSYKLACEMTDRIAAIASVTGSMTSLENTSCDASQPIPVMQIHGTADPTVPFEGSMFGLSIDDLVTYWANHNNCELDAITEDVPDINTDDGSTATRTDYLDCDGGTQVVYYLVDGGEHTWPGAAFTAQGVTNQDFSASAEIWNFFKEHTLESNLSTDPPEPPTSIENTTDVGLKIYPNKTKDVLTIESNELIKRVRLFDMQGQLVMDYTPSPSNSHELSLGMLANAIYFVQINEMGIKKIIKE